MHQASVGFHCPECAKKGRQQVYQGIPSLRTKPVLTYVLIGINVAVFVLGAMLRLVAVGERIFIQRARIEFRRN